MPSMEILKSISGIKICHAASKWMSLRQPNLMSLQNGKCIKEDKIPALGEASCTSCLTDSIPVLLSLDYGVEATFHSIELGPSY